MSRNNFELAYERINGRNYPNHDSPSNATFGLQISIEDDDETTLRKCCCWWRERFFTLEKLKRRLPILTWLPKYSLSDLTGDLVAGISVAFTIIPQGLALSVLAGLPPQYGLYASFMGCFIYAFFGTCKDAAVGPTAILSILIAPFVALGGIPYAVSLSFLTGCMMFILGILNLGFVVEFVSFPVISSFSTAAAITITASQLKGFFGLHFKASRFLPTIKSFFKNIVHLNPWDLALGVLCLAFLLPVQMNKDKKFSKKELTNPIKKIISWLWQVVVTGRNAMIVIICAMITALSQTNAFTLTGDIDLGLPPFRFPSFSIHTNETDKEFTETFSDLIAGVSVISLVGLLETVAVAKAFTSSKKFDATQEMIALGLCNIAGSFFGAFPVTGSFSRSAVNHSSGVRTPLGGIFTATLVVLSLLTLAPFFEYIPQTALSSIIIAAVIPMIRFDDMLLIWNAHKIDLIPYIFTLLSCLVIGLEYGICIGVTISLIILLYQMARPRVRIAMRTTPDGHDFLYVKPDRNVFFPSVEYMKVKINKALPTRDKYENFCVVIDGEHMFRTDATFGVGIKNMIESFKATGLLPIFYNMKKLVLKAIKNSLKTEEFCYCTSSDEVYRVIRDHMKNPDVGASEPNHNHPTARYWMSQSFEGR
ncbi:sodium-independent sulfate anion transporter-like protein [Dinothrombium tinctorium]|uniref:Sodium-independent sulfate anion transporter-like protein n=1 Tax=Dinothrombium tinctorium TaxID=1965070 RepID=A0A3S3PAG2_9ACAR|nr:sodium-independent sulfate anion transporter-like protein [Dinothrombium tinctorium]